MNQTFSFANQLLETLLRVVAILIPIVFTAFAWYFRNFVLKGEQGSKVGTISKLAGIAIDYVENLDKRDDLQVPDGGSKGRHKLDIASRWMGDELKKAGIDVSADDSKKWIGAEFQKRLGGVQMSGTLGDLAEKAVNIIQKVDGIELFDAPAGTDQVSHMVNIGADWLITELAKSGATISHGEASTWVRARLLERVHDRLSSHLSTTPLGHQMSGMAAGNQFSTGMQAAPSAPILQESLPVQEQIKRLAKAAVEHVERLKSENKISITGGAGDADIEQNLAVAWLLSEATNRGLPVSLDQIGTLLDEAR